MSGFAHDWNAYLASFVSYPGRIVAISRWSSAANTTGEWRLQYSASRRDASTVGVYASACFIFGGSRDIESTPKRTLQRWAARITTLFRGDFQGAALASRRDASFVAPANRWRRYAQPPANGCQASGLMRMQPTTFYLQLSFNQTGRRQFLLLLR